MRAGILFLSVMLLSFGCAGNDDLSKGGNTGNPENEIEYDLAGEVDENQGISLTGTKWKLAGFANVTNGIIKTPEPDSENHYWIIFNDDNTLSGKSSTNELVGNYEANYKAETIRITNLGGTKIGELLDGELFVKNLQSVYYFSVQKTSLQLYYSETDYLLFDDYSHETE